MTSNNYPHEAYKNDLSSLLENLHSLEAALRFALGKSGNQAVWNNQLKIFHKSQVGDHIPAGYLSNWANLSKLARQYQGTIASQSPKYAIPKSEEVVLLRDTLAHGIVIGAQRNPPLNIARTASPTEPVISQSSMQHS